MEPPTPPARRSIRQLNGWDRVALELLSIATILIGVGVLLYFFNSVRTDSGITEVREWTVETSEDGERPSYVLAFLDSFGVIIPILLIILGGLFVRLGLWLRQADVNAGRWSQIVYSWLTIGLGFVGVFQIVVNSADSDSLQLAAVIGLILIPIVAALFWLRQVIETAFGGEEAFAARDTRTAWNLLVPTLAVLIIVAARPLEQSFINSLTDKPFASQRVPAFVGFDNYRELLTVRFDVVECRRDDAGECRRNDDGDVRWQLIERDLLEDGYRTAWNIGFGERAIAISGLDKDWLESVWTTLQFVFGSVTLELLIGLFIALTVNSSFKGRGFMRAVMLVPWAIPTVISARLWELMLKDTTAGIINRVLMDVGLLSGPEAWLSLPELQIPSAVMIDVWKTSPFMALLLLAGLQTIPKDLYEAASVDGASRFRQFLHITLPMLRPTIGVALVFRTLDALRVFDLFNVLYGRQQLTMATYNYETLVNDQADGYASAIGVLIFIFVFIFAVIYVRMLGVEAE